MAGKLPTLKCVVVEDFAPTNPDIQLAVSENEVLVVTARHFKGWFLLRTTNDAYEGWVPQKCVEILSPLEAMHPFEDEDERTLNFRQGEILLGTKMGEWWLGCSSEEDLDNMDKVGYIPGSFVTPRPLKQAPNPPLSTAPDPGRPISTWYGGKGGGVSRDESGGIPRRSSPRKSIRSALKSIRFSRKPGQKNAKEMTNLNPVYANVGNNISAESPGPQKGAHGIMSDTEADAKTMGRKRPTRGSMNRINDKIDEPIPANLEFALYAANLGYACAFTLISFGILACVWDKKTYNDGSSLGSKYETGIYAIGLGCIIIPFENSFGNHREKTDWEQKDRYNIPIRALLYFSFAMNCFTAIPTIVPGIFMIITAIINFVAYYRGETGSRPAKSVQFPTISDLEDSYQNRKKKVVGWLDILSTSGIVNALNILRDEGIKEGNYLQYFWLTIYFTVNLVLWMYAYTTVKAFVYAERERIANGICEPLGPPIFGIEGGCLDTNNPGMTGVIDRCLLDYGALSDWGPVAKGFGAMLNFNCSLILIPVVRNLLKRLNRIAEDDPRLSIIKYIPLGDNISSHKLFAKVILFAVWGHTMAHFINFSKAPDMTLCFFNRAGPWDHLLRVDWGNDGETAWYTGGLILLAMFIMYSAASDAIRHASFEIFFFAHHMFILFYLCLLLHGPVFLWWGLIPIGLYVWERYLQQDRGRKRWFVNIANWIDPVLELQIRPENKEDFVFKEGEYLFLNCPAISDREWHPFTISSAHEDLIYGTRIESSTGKEAVPIIDQTQGQQFGDAITEETKYQVVDAAPDGTLSTRIIPKWQTEWNDFVSVHIKVHKNGWTEKLKNYLELKNATKVYPSHFTRRNEKGETVLGMEKLPPVGWNRTTPIPEAGELLPILRVDGPHSAPAVHYAKYPTVMLVGGGIGLTPCASILTSVIRYKWRKNFPPDTLHFYWVLARRDVDGFFWMMKRLCALEEELLSDYWKDQDAQESYKRFKVHIYITSLRKKVVLNDGTVEMQKYEETSSTIDRQKSATKHFDVAALRKLMLDPPLKSTDEFKTQSTENILKDRNDGKILSHISVWDGRPQWDEIYKDVKRPMGAGPGEVGVFFCGHPRIGADLQKYAAKNTNPELNQVFHLHKENF